MLIKAPPVLYRAVHVCVSQLSCSSCCTSHPVVVYSGNHSQTPAVQYSMRHAIIGCKPRKNNLTLEPKAEVIRLICRSKSKRERICVCRNRVRAIQAEPIKLRCLLESLQILEHRLSCVSEWTERARTECLLFDPRSLASIARLRSISTCCSHC